MPCLSGKHRGSSSDPVQRASVHLVTLPQPSVANNSSGQVEHSPHFRLSGPGDRVQTASNQWNGLG